MHPDFPLDPITIAIAVIAVLGALFGALGGDPPILWAIILFFLIAIPLLVIEFVGYFVYERYIEPRLERSS